MKISQYYEHRGVRLELTLETRDIDTHSKLNDLPVSVREDIKYQLFLAATYTQLQITHMRRDEQLDK